MILRRQFLGASAASAALADLASAAAPGLLEVSVGKQLAGTDFGGTILVVRAGSVLLRRGYGFANRSFGLPTAPDTTYRIASITKLFAATIVTRLWTAGRLDLDAPIATYLPAYKGPAGPAKD